MNFHRLSFFLWASWGFNSTAIIEPAIVLVAHHGLGRERIPRELGRVLSLVQPCKAQYVLVWSKHEVTPTNFLNFLLFWGLGPDFLGPICRIDENYRSRNFKDSYNSSISYTVLGHRDNYWCWCKSFKKEIRKIHRNKPGWGWHVRNQLNFLILSACGPHMVWCFSKWILSIFPTLLGDQESLTVQPLSGFGPVFGHLNEPKQVLTWCLFCRISCHF